MLQAVHTTVQQHQARQHIAVQACNQPCVLACYTVRDRRAFATCRTSQWQLPRVPRADGTTSSRENLRTNHQTLSKQLQTLDRRSCVQLSRHSWQHQLSVDTLCARVAEPQGRRWLPGDS